MLKKFIAVVVCACLLVGITTACNKQPSSITVTPTATVQARGDYGTQTSPLSLGVIGTFDGQGWNLAEAPYTLEISISDIKRGDKETTNLGEGEVSLPELAEGEEYFIVIAKVNLISSKNSSSVDFSAFTFDFTDENGQSICQCKLMGDLDSSLTTFNEGGYVETSLIGKVKIGSNPFIVFQKAWDGGLWFATN